MPKFFVLVGIIVIVVMVAFSSCITRTTIITPTTTETAGSTTTSAQLPNGLQLRVSANATSLTSGEALQVSVSEYNTLDKTNNVSAEKNWGVNGLSLGACPNINVQPFGVAIFQGRYTAQNVSQATPLRIYGPAACPMYIRLITGYAFLPHSIYAAVLPGGDLTTGTAMSANITVNEIYTEGIQSHPLDPGLYTVVAGDEWGSLEFLYITIE